MMGGGRRSTLVGLHGGSLAARSLLFRGVVFDCLLSPILLLTVGLRKYRGAVSSLRIIIFCLE